MVDYEALVLDLESYVNSRPSHGRRDLADKLIELKCAHRIPEGLVEKATRLYGSELHEVLTRRPADQDPVGVAAMADESPHRNGPIADLDQEVRSGNGNTAAHVG